MATTQLTWNQPLGCIVPNQIIKGDIRTKPTEPSQSEPNEAEQNWTKPNRRTKPNQVESKPTELSRRKIHQSNMEGQPSRLKIHQSNMDKMNELKNY